MHIWPLKSRTWPGKTWRVATLYLNSRTVSHMSKVTMTDNCRPSELTKSNIQKTRLASAKRIALNAGHCFFFAFVLNECIVLNKRGIRPAIVSSRTYLDLSWKKFGDACSGVITMSVNFIYYITASEWFEGYNYRWPFKTDLLITDRSKQTIQNRPRS